MLLTNPAQSVCGAPQPAGAGWRAVLRCFEAMLRFHDIHQLPERARGEERPDRGLMFLPRLLGDPRRSQMARAAMEAECRLLVHLRPIWNPGPPNFEPDDATRRITGDSNEASSLFWRLRGCCSEVREFVAKDKRRKAGRPPFSDVRTSRTSRVQSQARMFGLTLHPMPGRPLIVLKMLCCPGFISCQIRIA